MARRKKSSPLEDLMELVALMPWWAGCLLALVSYLLLHGVATKGAVTSTQIGAMMTQTVFLAFASVGQYLLPLICLFGAGLSAIGRSKRKSLVSSVVGSSSANALNNMSWQEFELLVGEGFRQQGYQVIENGGGGADGGIDLVLRKGGDKFLVQCKQWKAFTVGVTVVRELYGVMAANGAAGGFVVTSGRFTDDAEAFASGRNITLMDGAALFKLINQSPAARATRPPPAETASPKAVTAPLCPVCSKSMVQRVAKRGGSSGNAFWGCSGFPACRGTRPVV
ncbi:MULTISPECIES: restriction endonuclease [Comamonadaceae]|uniref:restriction endonuclease n=1 Tax=Comamonadaceae TaxID=80864 RepID=UPI0027325E4D|nr:MULTISPECIES: restriction endonuclease [Comamonadaceae]MDP3191433.1 restriction endonuclease [Rhodoferax sp.]MDP3883898.1 restriction endonuclease [Hydrogenophaga sp.]